MKLGRTKTKLVDADSDDVEPFDCATPDLVPLELVTPDPNAWPDRGISDADFFEQFALQCLNFRFSSLDAATGGQPKQRPLVIRRCPNQQDTVVFVEHYGPYR